MAVIIALVAMKDVRRIGRHDARAGIVEHLLEGWRYVFGFRPIRSLILQLAWLCLVAMPFSVLMPVFADEILGGGPYTLGFLMGASGLGALSGALWLTTRKSVVGLGRVILTNTVVFGGGLIGFALSRSLPVSIVFMTITGFGMMVQMASTNTVIQTIVDEEKRGRVLSFYTMSFLGTAPFGSLLAGWLSSRIGAPHTVAVERRPLHRDRGMVREGTACHPRDGASDLQAHGDLARSRAGAADGRNTKRITKNEKETKRKTKAKRKRIEQSERLFSFFVFRSSLSAKFSDELRHILR